LSLALAKACAHRWRRVLRVFLRVSSQRQIHRITSSTRWVQRLCQRYLRQRKQREQGLLVLCRTHCVVNYLTFLVQVVSEIQELYPNVKALPGLADVAKRQEVDSLIENTVSELGELSVMISNAGVISIHPLLDAPESELDRLISVNVKGLLNCGISAAKQFIAQNLNKVASGNTDPSGKIINAASISSYRAADYHGHYSMTKAAARSLTQTLAIELAPHQITVNAYAPGIVATPMWSEIDDTIGRINGVEKGETLKRVAGS